MKLIVYTLLNLIFLVSIYGQEKILIEHPAKKTGNLTMSELIDSLSYIPLETNEECLIGHIYRYDISGSYIMIFCGISEKVFLFDKNGAFIKQISGKGNSAQEYLYVKNVFIDEANNSLFICDLKKILVYDLSGQWKKNIPFELHPNNNFISYGSNTFLTSVISAFSEDYVYELIDINGRSVTKEIPRSKVMKNRIAISFSSGFHYIYNNQSYVRENVLNDTVYRINENNIFEPAYIIDAGKYKITPEFASIPENARRATDYMNITSVVENSNYFMINYLIKRKSYFIYYDKSNKKTEAFASANGIPNDFDGGPDLWPWRQINNQWHAFIPAEELTDIERTKNNTILKGKQESIQRFKEIESLIGSDDNPILIIAHLK